MNNDNFCSALFLGLLKYVLLKFLCKCSYAGVVQCNSLPVAQKLYEGIALNEVAEDTLQLQLHFAINECAPYLHAL